MTDSFKKRVADTARRWLKEQVIEDVPDDLARCEFGCGKSECRIGQWETCERRLEEMRDAREWRAGEH